MLTVIYQSRFWGRPRYIRSKDQNDLFIEALFATIFKIQIKIKEKIELFDLIDHIAFFDRSDQSIILSDQRSIPDYQYRPHLFWGR